MATSSSTYSVAEIEKISNNLVYNVKTKQPVLEKNGVKLVGIGLEELGSVEFVDNGYLAGDVYVDEKKECYQALGFKRFSWLSVFKALISAISRKALSEAKRQNISGNLSGDGLQNGGLLVIKKGCTELLLFHKEDVPGDHASNEEILESLGITQEQEEDQVPDHPKEELLVCDDNECSVVTDKPTVS